MRPHPDVSSIHPRSKGLALALLIALTVAPARAQVACKLLQPVELESTLKEWSSGGKATAFSGITDDSTGMVFDICESEIVRPDEGNLQIRIVVVTKLPMDGSDAIRTRNVSAAREGQWKVAGARFEEKSVDNAICTLSGRPNVAAKAVCSIPRAKSYLEVEVVAPSLNEVPSMDAVGALAQMANQRW